MVQTFTAARSRRGPALPQVAAAIGNTLEWYDFAAYGFFGGNVWREFLSARESLPVPISLVRRVRIRLLHPAAGRGAVRPCRRPRQPAHGVADLRTGDGDP